MKEAVTRKLREIVGSENVLGSPEARTAYSYDATAMPPHLPELVLRPATKEQVCAIVRLANEELFTVIPRGSGTSLSGGALPVDNSVVLLLNHWNRIHEIDSENFTALVEPGVITAGLHQAADRANLMYPPDPGSSSISTIGGNVAENAGGLRGLKYGVTKNYVMGLEAILPTGEIVWTGGKSAKDVAGFDLKSVLVGSEGTLGIFTKILLKLVPKPQSAATVVAFFPALDDAAKAVSAIVASRVTPAMLEFLDATTIRCVEDYAHLGLPVDAGAMLLIELDGHESAVTEDAARVEGVCRTHHADAVSTARDPGQSNRLKAARRSALASLARMKPTTIMEDVAVPRAALADLVHAVEEIGRRNNVLIGTFGHAGDGNLHPNYLTDERSPGEYARAQRCVEEVEQVAINLGGTITGEHGIGLYKREMLKRMVDAPAIRMMRTLKEMLDPQQILNTGKVVELKPRCEGILPNRREDIRKFEDVAWI